MSWLPFALLIAFDGVVASLFIAYWLRVKEQGR